VSQPAPYHSYTFRDYLDLEAASNVKHEFINGEIYAMAGGTPEHAALIMAIGATLVAQLRGGSCRVFSSDLRVRVLATGLATYPDISVVCGELRTDPESPLIAVNPKILIEVLRHRMPQVTRPVTNVAEPEPMPASATAEAPTTS